MNKLYIIRVYLVRGSDEILLDTITAWRFSEILKKRRVLVKAGFSVRLVRDDAGQMVFRAV